MVKICHIDSEDCLEQAESVIRNGDILVYPTDTLYGFGVDAGNNSALEKLIDLKERKGPWSVTVSDIDMLSKYAEIPQDRMDFILSHLPGGVTVILPAKRPGLSPHIFSGHNTIGVRIPDHSFPVKLTHRLQFPITSTSVNRTGEDPINNPETIKKTFKDRISLIVDDGVLPHSKGSRIYDLTEKEITLLRDNR